MLRRGILVSAVMALASGVTACTGKGEPPPNTSSAINGTVSASATPPPTRTAVPIDEVPPGNPSTWVPSGVPTTAPYTRAGDVVPKFTLEMFRHTQGGALDAARYYIDAENWSQTLQDYAAVTAICDASDCTRNAGIAHQQRTKGLHLVGGLNTPSAPKITAAPTSSKAEWIVQVRLSEAAGKLIDATGKTASSAPAAVETFNYYLRWNGKMWRISDVFLAS